MISPGAMERISQNSDSAAGRLQSLAGKRFASATKFRAAVLEQGDFSDEELDLILNFAEVVFLQVKSRVLPELDQEWFSPEQIRALKELEGRVFKHSWSLKQALAGMSPAWRSPETDSGTRTSIQNKLDHLRSRFQIPDPSSSTLQPQ